MRANRVFRPGRPVAPPTCVLVVAAALLGCGQSAQEHLADARQELAEAAYLEAISAADAGLAGSPDEKTAWGLELVKLEAHARAGQGEETKQLLQRLAELQPERMPTTQYAATADQLRTAGEGPAAIEVLDLGLQRYPGDATIERLIGASQAGDGDPAELEMLRTLGYIE